MQIICRSGKMFGAGASPSVKTVAVVVVCINQVTFTYSESLIATTVDPANAYLYG